MTGLDPSSSESEDLDYDKEAFGKEYIRRYGLYNTSSASHGGGTHRRRKPPSTLQHYVSVSPSRPHSLRDKKDTDRVPAATCSASNVSRPAVQTTLTSRPPPENENQSKTRQETSQVGQGGAHAKGNGSRKREATRAFGPKAVLAVLMASILLGVLWQQQQLQRVHGSRQSQLGRRHAHPPAGLGLALKSPHLKGIHGGIWAVVEQFRESKVEDIDVAVGSFTDLANSVRTNQNLDSVISSSLGTETILQLRQVTALDGREGYRPLLHSLTLIQLDNERVRKSVNEIYLALSGWRRTSTQNTVAAQETLHQRNVQARSNVYSHISPGQSLRDRAEHVRIEARLCLWKKAVDWITHLADEAHKELSWREIIAEHLQEVVQLVTQRIGDLTPEPLDVVTVPERIDLQVRDLIRIEYRGIFEASSMPEVMNLVAAYLPVD